MGGIDVAVEELLRALVGRWCVVLHVVAEHIHSPAEEHLSRQRDVTGLFLLLNGSSLGQCRTACPARVLTQGPCQPAGPRIPGAQAAPQAGSGRACPAVLAAAAAAAGTAEIRVQLNQVLTNRD